jgi:DNA mismatch repair protein MutS
VAEHLATSASARPKTLFATHYPELTDLADLLPGVVNAHVSAREWKDEIVFLRKIVPGRSDRSYGIHVARLAGLPDRVVRRAREILDGLERDELSRGGRPSLSSAPDEPHSPQLGLFAPAVVVPTDAALEALAERLRGIDVDATTPIEAIALLAELAALARKRPGD